MTRNRGVPAELCIETCPECLNCCTAEDESHSRRQDVRTLLRWAWWLTAATIVWNSLEGVVAIATGLVARSIALVGFGLDSVVETASAFIIAWRLFRHSPDEEANQRTERKAVRLIALSFFAIALYVTYDAVAKLSGLGEHPERSAVGLALVVLSLLVMPMLAWAKRKVAAGLGSAALRADAAETQLCLYLSVVVLIGLIANAVFGWWWMDPIAGLVVAVLAFREGREAWEGGELEERDPTAERFSCPPICCPTCPALLQPA